MDRGLGPALGDIDVIGVVRVGALLVVRAAVEESGCDLPLRSVHGVPDLGAAISVVRVWLRQVLPGLHLIARHRPVAGDLPPAGGQEVQEHQHLPPSGGGTAQYHVLIAGSVVVESGVPVGGI